MRPPLSSVEFEVDRGSFGRGGELHIARAEVLHQRHTETTLDEQAIRVLHVGNVDEIGKPTALIDHCEVDPVWRNAERDRDPPRARNALISLDRIGDGLGGDPPQIVQAITIEHFRCRCRCSNNHSDDRDEVSASGDVDVDDM